MLIFVVFLSVAFALYFYVEAFRSGLQPKMWAVAGFLLGPAIFPMFSISQHVALRKAQGFGNEFLKA